MLQVVDYNTKLYALKRGFTDIEEFDIPKLEEKYGIRKDQFLDLKALQGDSSDNIPGVPGVGQKTAIALLQEYDNLDHIYDHLDEIKPAWAKKLSEGKELAYISKQLGEIQFDAPIRLDLDEMDVRKLDTAKLRGTLQKLEFRSLLRRLPDFMQSDEVIETEAPDEPGLFFALPGGKVVVNDGKVLCAKLLKLQQALPSIEFDTRIAGFLLGRTEPVSDEKSLKTLYDEQLKKFEDKPKLLRLAKQLDFPMQRLLAEIEARGVKIDSDGLAKLSADFGKKVNTLEKEIWELAGKEFNVGSPAQLSEVLFEKLQLPTAGIKRGRSGTYSTGRSELDKLKSQHEIIAKIGDYREVAKLKNTYVDTLPKLVDKDGYLHTSLHQDVTATGRLSSSNPNLQNIPIRSKLGQEIRRYFIASKGKVLVSADYSQFELRLAAA